MKHIFYSFCKWCWIGNKFEIIHGTWIWCSISFNKTTFYMHNLFDGLFTEFRIKFFNLKRNILIRWALISCITSSGRVRDFSNSSCVNFCCRIGFARCFCFSWYSFVNNFVGNRPFLDTSIKLEKKDGNSKMNLHHTRWWNNMMIIGEDFVEFICITN